MKKLIIVLFFLNTLNVIAQGEANIWYFGKNAGLDFNNGTAVALTNGQLNTREGCSSFSDTNGNLLFYSDGTTVWNKNHIKMPNGVGLKGNASSTQSAMIIPRPESITDYFIFTVGTSVGGGEFGFNYYSIDMTKEGGLGDIVSGPVDLSQENSSEWSEKVAAIKGDACSTYWVISYAVNKFYAYKIDANGVAITPVISPVSFIASDRRGYLKISPDGKKIAIAHMGDASFLLYDFDDVTGKVSNQITLPLVAPANKPYGAEFSANSEKLYVNASNDYYSDIYNEWNNPNNHFSTLYQFNLSFASTNDIIASRVIIDSQNLYRGALQLGPDQKIYRALSRTYDIGIPALGVIENPENDGLNCKYSHASVNLTSRSSTQGLPPFIASILLPVEITDGISTNNINNSTVKRCIGDNYQLTAQNIQGTPTYKWIYNGTTISDTATLTIPSLNTLNQGTYYLEVETIDNCGTKILYKGEVSVEVYNPPIITKPTDISHCDDDNDGYFTFDLNNLKDAEVLNGQNSSEFEVKYFTNQTDADANTNPITNPYTNTSPFSTDTIIARIHNIQNPICYETESFIIQVFESPNPPTIITNLTTCDTNGIGNDTDGLEIFDLTSKENEILNGQSATDFTITYFSDAALTNPITETSAFQNTTADSQTIYIQIVNNYNSSCKTTTSFDIEVYSLPIINYSFTIKQCDEDGIADGFTDFNLNEVNDYLTLGDVSLSVTYFLTYSDADLNINQINASPYSNSIQPTVYARIETINGCHRVAQIDLLVSSTSFPDNYLKTMIHCDDDDIIDGLHLFDLSQNSAEIINLFPSGQNLRVSYYRNLNDAQLEENEIPTDGHYMSERPFNQTVYVRVESKDNGECFGFGPYLNLVVNSRPEFDLDESAIYCQNLPSITVPIYNPKGSYTYEWTSKNGTVISNDPYATISKEGEYTVIATSADGCKSFPHTIIIEPSIIASISYNDITVVDDSINNTISIATANLGIGDYEFTMDDIYGTYQDEPFFEGVIPGIHTIFVRDKNNCGIAQIDVSVIGFPKFFTPNNDGYNDTWVVLGVNENFYTSSNIYIFDRFGKLITQIDPRGEGWNGLFNGKYLPTTDYWFSVELIDNNGNIRIRKGHFSLIR